MIISVVIPTFNRGALLANTVEHLLRSGLAQDAVVEIIVVDDGSRVPAEVALSAVSVEAPFSLQTLRQANAGPASARNAGFRAAKGAVVLFVDDDILVRPDLIACHLDAHRRFPQSVVFGHFPFSGANDSPLLRYVNALNTPPSSPGHTRVDRVASGALSVERSQFAAGGVYREDLCTPGAEEFELSYRLGTQGIPIIFAADILGIHSQPVELSALCAQQHKYGVGLAEAAAKCADLEDMPELQVMLRANQIPRVTDPPGMAVRKILKAFFGRPRPRAAAVRIVRRFERILRGGSLLETAYRALLGASLYAGVQEGRRLFGPGGRT